MNEHRRKNVLAITVIFLVYVQCSSSTAFSVMYRSPLEYFNKDVPDTAEHQIAKRAVTSPPVTIPQKVVKRQLHNLHGQPGQGYYIEMGIGSPPQKFKILVDTGSSNFAVAGAPDPDIDYYFNSSLSSTYSYDGTEVYVPYTQGKWTGTLAHDLVTIPSLPSVNVTADIAFITKSSLFFQNKSHWQGILGLAYAEIVRPNTNIEVFMDTLKQQAPFPDLFSMQLCGVVDLPNKINVNTGGTLIFGGLDKSLYKGDIVYTPIYKEWYYEVIVTDFSVGRESLGLDCKEYNFDKTIVDSGTTNLRLPKKVFYIFVQLLKQLTREPFAANPIPDSFWAGIDKLCWTQYLTPWEQFPTVKIELAASADSTFTLEISPQQYMREVSDEPEIQTSDDCYKFAVSPSESGTVLGAVIMEGFYVIFDRENKRVGFAQTTCSSNQQNSQLSRVTGIQKVNYNTTKCAYIKPEPNITPLTIAAYVMGGLCVLCLVPLLLFVFQCQYHRRCRKRRQVILDDNQLLEPDGDYSRKHYSSFSSTRFIMETSWFSFSGIMLLFLYMKLFH